MGAHPDAPRRALPVRIVRRLAREIVRLLVLLLELGHRTGRILLRTEYTVEGGCKQRGACCHHILLEWSPLLDRFPFLGKVVLWKLTRFYDFYDKGYSWEVQDGLLVRVLGCHALREDGRCGAYRLRPLFCRTYPEVPLTGRPLVLKGCGYSFARRDGAPEEPELVQIGRTINRSSSADRGADRRSSASPAEGHSAAHEDAARGEAASHAGHPAD